MTPRSAAFPFDFPTYMMEHWAPPYSTIWRDLADREGRIVPANQTPGALSPITSSSSSQIQQGHAADGADSMTGIDAELSFLGHELDEAKRKKEQSDKKLREAVKKIQVLEKEMAKTNNH